jgi:hypothetical protein
LTLTHERSFSLFLYHPPDRSGAKSVAIAVFNASVLISIVPVVFAAFLPPAGPDPYHDRRWVSAIFWGAHGFYVNPLLTIVGLAVALFDQARELLLLHRRGGCAYALYRDSPQLAGRQAFRQGKVEHGALSLCGLGVQAVLFLAVGSLCGLGHPPAPWQLPFAFWYRFGNCGFAGVQAVLFVTLILLKRDTKRRALKAVDCETQPLLDRTGSGLGIYYC